jgi:hypothetical protein
MRMPVEQTIVALALLLGAGGLVAVVAKSKRASRFMSLLILNVVLGVTLVHTVWPQVEINAFTLSVMTVLGVPGAASVVFIHNYLL